MPRYPQSCPLWAWGVTVQGRGLRLPSAPHGFLGRPEQQLWGGDVPPSKQTYV